MMITPPLSTIDFTVDRYELAQAIRTAFAATVGETEIVDVYVSRFPHEYGVVVLLAHAPSPDTETEAIRQEEQLRAAGIPVGILVRQALLAQRN